jgi:hypothetical protein
VQLPPVDTVPPVEGQALVPVVSENGPAGTEMLFRVRGAVPVSETVMAVGELDAPTLLLNESVAPFAGARPMVGKFADPDSATV